MRWACFFQAMARRLMSVSSKRLPLLALLVLSVASSCAVVHNPGKSPLARTQMSRDSVVLDVFFVRFPIGQEQVEDRLWKRSTSNT